MVKKEKEWKWKREVESYVQKMLWLIIFNSCQDCSFVSLWAIWFSGFSAGWSLVQIIIVYTNLTEVLDTCT